MLDIHIKTDPHRIFVIITGGEPLMGKDLEECRRMCGLYPFSVSTEKIACIYETVKKIYSFATSKGYLPDKTRNTIFIVSFPIVK